jgi:hypothetical protein
MSATPAGPAERSLPPGGGEGAQRPVGAPATATTALSKEGLMGPIRQADVC